MLARDWNKEYDNLMKKACKLPLEWTKKNIGGIECDVLVLSVYRNNARKSDVNRNYYTDVKLQAEVRQLFLFFCEKNGHTFVGATYKQGPTFEQTDRDKNFFQEWLSGIKFY